MNIANRLLLAALCLLPTLVCAAPAGDAEAGRRAFQACASCHAVGPRAHSGFGPQLNGLIGRRAGSLKDYRYSEAMTRSGIVWDERTLAAFIKGPSDVVPGTRMRFWGIGDERRIADLIAYLRGFSLEGGAVERK
ncbi:c-type cytochrome [Noviherbaspirillum pedocola]|uniref:Cytochrome c family protein n=1 Tax=Noviherbaspirillum pedocola TaxID=2801341 RepID=A0A934T0M9_9BURK|nr:cytochrome c family protein [Noviherbaspirillum pedocola]MBK4736607.1 cytochrome c family protein [Noviherbaspirillum pedocola]